MRVCPRCVVWACHLIARPEGCWGKDLWSRKVSLSLTPLLCREMALCSRWRGLSLVDGGLLSAGGSATDVQTVQLCAKDRDGLPHQLVQACSTYFFLRLPPSTPPQPGGRSVAASSSCWRTPADHVWWLSMPSCNPAALPVFLLNINLLCICFHLFHDLR